MLAVIRVRGRTRININLKKTLDLLCLTRANHMVLLHEKQLPMLKKTQAFITWGEINEATLEKLLKKRAKTAGNKKIDSEFLKKHGFKSTGELAKAIMQGKITLKQAGLKKVFRLKPPTKGFERKGIKKTFALGGALGYRAAEINELLERMI